jgi:hypothetical protein
MALKTLKSEKISLTQEQQKTINSPYLTEQETLVLFRLAREINGKF